MFGDKSVVVQMRVGRIHAIDFFALSRAECLVGIQAPDSFEQSLEYKKMGKQELAAGSAD